MVRIRLSRTGRRNYATFRLAVMPRTAAVKSRAIEYIGNYNPNTKEINIDKERAEYWLSVGAQPTDTVIRLFVKEGIMKKDALPEITFNKKPGKKATERQEKADEKSTEKEKSEEKPQEQKEESEEPKAEKADVDDDASKE